MGKAIIKSDYGSGKYLVEIQMQQGYTNDVLARLNQRIVYLESQIVLAEADLDELYVELLLVEGENLPLIEAAEEAIETYEDQIKYLTSQLTTLNAELAVLEKTLPLDQSAITAKKAEITAKKAEIAEEEEKVAKKENEIAEFQAKIDTAKLNIEIKKEQIAFIKAELLSTEKRYALIRRLGIINNYNLVAWCCDLTEGLTGTVTILEITTDIDSGVNIFPAYENGSGLPGYSVKTMGEFLPFATLPVADALRNFIAMPAIQKWAPSFRYGTIYDIDYESNTCTVNLEQIRSRIQTLAIDQSTSLSNVPIEYMYCDAGAFEIDDEVVVQFIDHDWAQPKVIGFKKEPKPCGWEEPWNGPNIQWKYPWQYTYSFSGGTGTIATRTITNGIMTMSFPPTDSGSGAYGQNHYLQYTLSGEAITRNVTKIKVDVSSEIQCYSGGSCTHEYSLVVVGWDETETKLINYIATFVYNGYWPHIGCSGFDYFETEWGLTGSGNASVWWLPGGPYPYETYERLIDNDKDVYFSVPKMMSKVLAIGLEMNVNWVGGAEYNQPAVIEGGSLACDLIALA